MYYPSFLMNDRRKNKILLPQQERGLTITATGPGRDASRSGNLCERMAK